MDRLANWILIVALFVGLSVQQSDRPFFQPYGDSQGDSILHRNDDESSPQLPLIGNFKFFGVPRTYLYLNNNGIFSFDNPLWQYTPDSLNTVGFPAVAIYWADVDTRPNPNGGFLYYRMSLDAAQLSSVSSWIRACNPGNTFAGTRMFVATWKDVGYYSYHVEKICTFQAIIIADDGGNTFAVFNYGNIEWTTGDASGGSGGFGGVPAVAGFTNGAGTYAQIAGSLTGAIVNIELGTNAYINGVPQTGQYLFQISDGVVITSCCSATPAPVLNGAPTELDFSITNINQVPSFTGQVSATVHCPTPTSSINDVSTINLTPTIFSVFGCPVRRTWTGTDTCLRSTSVTQTFTYPEVFSEPLTMTSPPDFSQACVSNIDPSVTGNAFTNRGANGQVSYTDGPFVSQTCSASNGYATAAMTRVWTAVDICETRKYDTQTITRTQPVPSVSYTNDCMQANNLYHCFDQNDFSQFLTATDPCTGGSHWLSFNNDCRNNLGNSVGCDTDAMGRICLWGSLSGGRNSYSFSYSTGDQCGRTFTYTVTVPMQSGSSCSRVPQTDLYPSLTTSEVTSSAVTSAALTSSAVTSAAVTSAAVTSQAVTSAAVTSAALTTGQMTAPEYCDVQEFPEGIVAYYCSQERDSFYMCMKGPWNPLSVVFLCPPGTGCHCAFGEECSGFGAYSPCT